MIFFLAVYSVLVSSFKIHFEWGRTPVCKWYKSIMVLFFSSILTVIKWSADKKKAIRFPPGKVVSKRYFLLSFLKQQQQKNHWNIFLLPKQFSIKTEVLLKVEQVTQVKDETIKHFKIAETNNDCYVSFFNDHNILVVNYQKLIICLFTNEFIYKLFQH